MCRIVSLGSAAAAMLVSGLALAQSAAPVTSMDTGAAITTWVCANQAWVSWAIGALIAHTGLSAVSATLKKAGIDGDNPIIKIIRLLAIDVRPPDAAIVRQAAAIVSAAPAIMATTGADPVRMANAADAIKNAPKP